MIFQRKWNFVNREVFIFFFDDGLNVDIAEQSDFLTLFPGDALFAPADQHVWLDTDLAKLTDGVLRWFRLDFRGSFQVGDEGQVNE